MKWFVGLNIAEAIDTQISKEFVAFRKYAQSFTDNETSVMMEDYPEDTQELLKRIVKEEGPGPVTKEDLKKYGSADSWWDKAFSPIGQVQNTLGQFNINKDMQIEDAYDWSESYKKMPYFGAGFRNTLGKIAYEYGVSQEGNVKPYSMDVLDATNTTGSVPATDNSTGGGQYINNQ